MFDNHILKDISTRTNAKNAFNVTAYGYKTVKFENKPVGLFFLKTLDVFFFEIDLTSRCGKPRRVDSFLRLNQPGLFSTFYGISLLVALYYLITIISTS